MSAIGYFMKSSTKEKHEILKGVVSLSAGSAFGGWGLLDLITDSFTTNQGHMIYPAESPIAYAALVGGTALLVYGIGVLSMD